MPTKTVIKQVQRAKREGQPPSTQAGPFVKKEMEAMRTRVSGIKSRKQAIAIGLSEARRAGVKLTPPKQGKATSAVRKKAARDVAQAQGQVKTSPSRSRGAKKAAATRRRNARSRS